MLAGIVAYAWNPSSLENNYYFELEANVDYRKTSLKKLS